MFQCLRRSRGRDWLMIDQLVLFSMCTWEVGSKTCSREKVENVAKRQEQYLIVLVRMWSLGGRINVPSIMRKYLCVFFS